MMNIYKIIYKNDPKYKIFFKSKKNQYLAGIMQVGNVKIHKDEKTQNHTF